MTNPSFSSKQGDVGHPNSSAPADEVAHSVSVTVKVTVKHLKILRSSPESICKFQASYDQYYDEVVARAE